jgi:hypothetical protein
VAIGQLNLGATSNALTDPSVAFLQLSLIGVSDSGPYDLIVQGSVNDVPTAPAPQVLDSLFAGSILPVNGTVGMRTWVDNSNTVFGTTGPGIVADTGETTFSPDGTQTYEQTATLNGTPNYSITTQIRAIFTGGASLSIHSGNRITPSPVQPDARVTLTPDATNEVGQPHTFTALVEQDDGLPAGAAGGDAYTGFGPAANANVAVALANSNGASAPVTSFTGTTNAAGQFQVTFASPTAGLVVGNATATVAVGGLTLTRDTDPATSAVSGPGGSGPATKRFVDARIAITPDAVNAVGDPHTFTVTVLQDDGLTAAQGGDGVTGFAPAAGQSVTVALANLNGASTPATSFTGTTNAAGQFQVTFTSATAGLVVGNASTSFVVGGQTLVRDTDPATAAVSGPGGSGPATKRFVDAKVTITPDAVNAVGDPHTFTVTVLKDAGDGLGFVPAAGDSVSVTLAGLNGASAPVTSFFELTNAAGQFQVTFASPTAGLVVGNATASVVVGGQTLVRDTDPATAAVSGPGGSGPATKRFVDAKVTITPDAVNEVGQPHTFTVTVLENAGDGAGFVPAAGESVTVALANSNGASAPVTSFTGTTNAAGQFQVTFASPTAGLVVGNATATVAVGGLTLTRDTDPATSAVSGPGGSGPATKRFVDARIAITPDAVNAVGDPHTFTVTVLQDDGLTAAQGGDGVTGFAPAAGQSVTVALANLNGASTPATSFTGTTNAAGQFQVTFTSATAGLVVGNASTSFVVGGQTLVRDTDPATAAVSGPGGSGPATKRFVDARIVLTPPSAVNPVNDPHVITAAVYQDDGLPAGAPGGDAVTGFGPVPNGTAVSFSLVNSGGATAAFVGGGTAVVSGGTASVTINSPTAGLVTINGSVVLAVGGVVLTRDTDPATGPTAGPGGTGPVTKTYVTPGIDIEKTTNGPTNSNPTAPDYDNEDAPNGPGVPVLTPGSTVTWTYKVTNTGGLPFPFNEVVVTDDNGTPANTADDLSTTNGQLTFLGVQTGNADNVLEPGEVWLYQATGTVQNLGGSGAGTPVTFDFSGNSAVSGAAGNVRTFTSGPVSVKASAFSRDKSTGAWAPAYLGSYGGGLGVTDGSESGGGNTHTVDNVGRDNFILLEFSENVIIDAARLGYVVTDSDLWAFIGTAADPFNNHLTLSDALLSGYNLEANAGGSSARTANLNAGNLSGNVFVIGADPTSADDYFKFETLTLCTTTPGTYENKATVTVPGAFDSDLSHYKNNKPKPGIDIEKTTNGPTNSNPTAPDYDNEDAPNGPGVPALAPGSTVTWTYKVTNTGNVAFARSEVVVVDDAGTPGTTADDMSTTNGQVTFLGVQSGDADNILEPGEVWLYKATGTVQTLTTATGTSAAFDFSGNSALSGAAGNVRSFTAGGVTVNASAFSRTSGGTWNPAYLGSYGGGLGVTDGSEDGGGNTHTTDNSGRGNYILLEFSQSVILDSAFLGYVVGDSDLSVWIGTVPGTFNAHQTLSDAFLAGLGFTEVNTTSSSGARTAGLNAGGLAGNVVVIAAKADESNDSFKLETVKVKKTQAGVYENKATVTVPGGSDSDLSHYKNPTGGTISGKKYRDVSGNGLNLTGGTNSPADTPLPGVTVYLDLNNNGVLNTGEPTQVTDGDGAYTFTGLPAGTYYVREVVSAGFVRTAPATADYIKVALPAGGSSADNSFANYEMICAPCTIANVSYKLVHPDGTSEVVSDLRGQTTEGDVVTVTFWIEEDGSFPMTLVSYTAPEPYFNANTAGQQKIYDLSTGTFGPGGPYTLTVTIPNCYYQIDFVCGYAIDQLGPVGSNVFYTPQDRLISADNGGSHAGCDAGGSISGVKYKDVDGDGVRDAGEPGLKDWVIYVDLNNNGVKDANEPASVTKADGSYTISNLPAGNYKVREVQQAGWVATQTPGTVALAAGQDKTGVNFGNKAAAAGRVSGYKFNDRNADGEWDKNGMDNCWNNSDDEAGLAGWTIFVDYDGDGVKDANEPSAVTDASGYYSIAGVAAGTWDVVEVMQSGWVRTTPERIVSLSSGESETNVNFGNFKGSLVMSGDTATVNFWKGTNGKALIYKLNGGGSNGTAKALGNWLAANFDAIYGSGCGSNNLAGKTNAQIYSYLCSLVNSSSKQLEAQVLATALAAYVTDSDWAGGTYAAAYGFTVTSTGVKNDYFNVGDNGAAFGVANDSALTVWDVLQRTNTRARNGSLWSSYSSGAKAMAYNVFLGINQSGGITS